jgi:hypothetical protein
MMFSNFVSFIQVLVFSLYVHPIHVSVTEIEFDQKDRALKIMMRVFIDDLEASLRDQLNQPELDILALKKGVTVDQLVSTYLRDHFKISLDNNVQKTNFLGHERESEAFIFYIEVTNVNSWQTIKIQNDILVSTFDDQSNLVHVTVNDKVKSLRLTKSTPADKLTFENQ